MTPIKCVAIDDEPFALRLLEEYISRIPALKLAKTFQDAIEGAEFLKAGTVDLLFVDINMPDITGLELVKHLPQKPMIVFTTAYKNFAFEGFELDAVDYLLKPFSFERFEKAVNKAMEQYQHRTAPIQEDEEVIFVRAEYHLVKIRLAEIEYIESVQDYLKIHLTNGRPVMTLMTLKAMLDKLPTDKFRRIHRSYVVALSKIRSIANRKVKLGIAELPISDSYIDFLSSKDVP